LNEENSASKQKKSQRYLISILSKIGFSLDSTWRGQALEDVLISDKERSKPLIYNAGQVLFGLTKARLMASPLLDSILRITAT